MVTLEPGFLIEPLRPIPWLPDDNTQSSSESLLEWQRSIFFRKFEALVTLISKVISSLKLKKLNI